MAHAKLASLLSLLLIQTPQDGGRDPLEAIFERLILFAFFPAVIFLLASAYVAFLTLFFGAFAVPPVFGVQWLYRRAVLRGMRAPGGSAPAARVVKPTAADPTPTRRTRAPSSLRLEMQDPDAAGAEQASPLNRRAVEASGAVTRVYAAAAAACAVALTPLAAQVGSYLRTIDPALNSFSAASFYLCAFVSMMWLPVLVFVVAAVGRVWLKLFVLAAYSLLLGVPVLLLPDAVTAWAMLIMTWCLLMAPPTSMLLVLRFSGVGGLALGMIFSLAAPALALGVKVLVSNALAHEDTTAAGATLTAGDVAVLASLALVMVGPVVAVLAAGGLLWWLSNRYARKQTSQQLLLLDTFWLVTIFIVSSVSYVCGAGWLTLLGPLAFAVYKLAVGAGLRRLGPASGGGRPELRLLLLRVFGAKRRSEWLLKRLGHYWLYSGSIQLISAPDLAAANLDLDEMLDFLRGRLRYRFVKDGEDCRRRIASLDVRPDPDGRYRVNEFFCYEDVWFETVGALMEQTDAVLMDLRGFTAANDGCVRELHRLVDAVPVNRLVILVNEQTDIDFLGRTFEGAWAGMGAGSPNRDLASPVLRLLNVRRQNSRAVRRLLSMLCEAAEAPRPAAAGPGGEPAATAPPAGLAARPA